MEKTLIHLHARLPARWALICKGGGYLRVTDEQIAKAKSVDLLSYLQANEPNNLRHLGRDTWCTREHDSLKITGSNGMWHWFSRHIGGRNALDYLMKVRGYSFLDAVQTLSEDMRVPILPVARFEEKTKELVIPPLNDNIDAVRAYLQGRGIHPDVIERCYNDGILREDRKYHNCIFIGYDGDKPKYAASRSTIGPFKKDLPGSDKRFSFCIHGDSKVPYHVHVFEAAIDAMSYMSIIRRNGDNMLGEDLLSLSGVYVSEHGQDVPAALKTYLERNPQITTVWLHLDNDEVGRKSTEFIAGLLKDKYEVIDSPAKSGKDYNEYLQNEIQKEKQRKDQAR